MRTCSLCNASAPDTAHVCPHCQANLDEFSVTAAALRSFQNNPRVTAVRISVAGDACPLCYESRGTFAKDKAPILPHEGCSHEGGCHCTYEPVLNEIYP